MTSGPAASADDANPTPSPIGEASASSGSRTLPPAGWYPDPQKQAHSRWWDGSAFTEHVHNPDATAVRSERLAGAASRASAGADSTRSLLVGLWDHKTLRPLLAVTALVAVMWVLYDLVRVFSGDFAKLTGFVSVAVFLLVIGGTVARRSRVLQLVAVVVTVLFALSALLSMLFGDHSALGEFRLALLLAGFSTVALLVCGPAVNAHVRGRELDPAREATRRGRWLTVRRGGLVTTGVAFTLAAVLSLLTALFNTGDDAAPGDAAPSANIRALSYQAGYQAGEGPFTQSYIQGGRNDSLQVACSQQGPTDATRLGDLVVSGQTIPAGQLDLRQFQLGCVAGLRDGLAAQ